jgi:hypothetical protein
VDVVPPDDFPPTEAGPAADEARSSMASHVASLTPVAATPSGLKSSVQPPGSSVLLVDPATSPIPDGMQLDSPATSSSSGAPPPRAHTHLQNAIVKPKKLFPGMIRYANFLPLLSLSLSRKHSLIQDGNMPWMLSTHLYCKIIHGIWFCLLKLQTS